MSTLHADYTTRLATVADEAIIAWIGRTPGEWRHSNDDREVVEYIINGALATDMPYTPKLAIEFEPETGEFVVAADLDPIIFAHDPYNCDCTDCWIERRS